MSLDYWICVSFYGILASSTASGYMGVIEFEIQRYTILDKTRASEGGKCDTSHANGAYNPCDLIFFVEDCRKNHAGANFACTMKIDRFYGPSSQDEIIFNSSIPKPSTMFYLFNGFPRYFMTNVSVWDEDDDVSGDDFVGNYKIVFTPETLVREGKLASEPVEQILVVPDHSEMIVRYRAYCLDIECYNEPDKPILQTINILSPGGGNIGVQSGNTRNQSAPFGFSVLPSEELFVVDNKTLPELRNLTNRLILQYLSTSYPDQASRTAADLVSQIKDFNNSAVIPPGIPSLEIILNAFLQARKSLPPPQVQLPPNFPFDIVHPVRPTLVEGRLNETNTTQTTRIQRIPSINETIAISGSDASVTQTTSSPTDRRAQRPDRNFLLDAPETPAVQGYGQQYNYYPTPATQQPSVAVSSTIPSTTLASSSSSSSSSSISTTTAINTSPRDVTVRTQLLINTTLSLATSTTEGAGAPPSPPPTRPPVLPNVDYRPPPVLIADSAQPPTIDQEQQIRKRAQNRFAHLLPNGAKAPSPLLLGRR